MLEQEKRGPALKNRPVGEAEIYKGLLNRASLRATDRAKYFLEYVETPLHQGSAEGVPLEILSVQSSKKRKFRNVKWIGDFQSWQRLRDAWMDNLPMSSMSKEKRQGQYLADVAQENAERLTRGEMALDPNTPGNRERWNTAQVNNHESLFPVSDNLISLFFVGSDLSEPQREGLNITAYTFEAVARTFLEIFCTPKSSMENPVSRMNRTFTVESCQR